MDRGRGDSSRAGYLWDYKDSVFMQISLGDSATRLWAVPLWHCPFQDPCIVLALIRDRAHHAFYTSWPKYWHLAFPLNGKSRLKQLSVCSSKESQRSGDRGSSLTFPDCFSIFNLFQAQAALKRDRKRALEISILPHAQWWMHLMFLMIMHSGKFSTCLLIHEQSSSWAMQLTEEVLLLVKQLLLSGHQQIIFTD